MAFPQVGDVGIQGQAGLVTALTLAGVNLWTGMVFAFASVYGTPDASEFFYHNPNAFQFTSTTEIQSGADVTFDIVASESGVAFAQNVQSA
jgi:hypothetical protein